MKLSNSPGLLITTPTDWRRVAASNPDRRLPPIVGTNGIMFMEEMRND